MHKSLEKATSQNYVSPVITQNHGWGHKNANLAFQCCYLESPVYEVCVVLNLRSVFPLIDTERRYPFSQSDLHIRSDNVLSVHSSAAFTALIFKYPLYSNKIHSELLNIDPETFNITRLHSAILSTWKNSYNIGKQVGKNTHRHKKWIKKSWVLPGVRRALPQTSPTA